MNNDLYTIYKFFTSDVKKENSKYKNITLSAEDQNLCGNELKSQFGKDIEAVIAKYYSAEYERKKNKKLKERLELGNAFIDCIDEDDDGIFLSDKLKSTYPHGLYFVVNNDGDLHDPGMSEYYYGARSDARDEVGYGNYDLYACVYANRFNAESEKLEKVPLITLELNADQETDVSDEKVYFSSVDVNSCFIECNNNALKVSSKEEFVVALNKFIHIVIEYIKCEESDAVIDAIKEEAKKEIKMWGDY